MSSESADGRVRPDGSLDAAAAWTTHAPAKVNLDLRMLGVRADGYHLLRTVLQSIALADTLTLRRHAGPFALSCATPGVPTDATNLAWKGAAAMAAALGVSLDGWRMEIEKAVPAEAGLGGGSSDAAAAARLVARAAGAEMTPPQLAGIIRPLGADVSFFAYGGAVRGEGVGDELTPLPDVPAAAVLLVRPPFGVSTRDAYGWYDEANRGRASEQREPGTGNRQPGTGSQQLGTENGQPGTGNREPGTGDREPGTGGAESDAGKRSRGGGAEWSGWADCGNDLEAAVAERHPEIRAIVRRIGDAGAWLAAMSGSGSACFGVFPPDLRIDGLEAGWPEGTRVWRTRLLSRADYNAMTQCVPLRCVPPGSAP